MGRELQCRATHEGRTAEVTALLETGAVILRGEIKATIPFKSLTRVGAIDGDLHLGDTILELGPEAEKWAHKILHPPSLLDKLGIKQGMKVALLGFSDRAFMLDHPFDSCLVEGVSYDIILFHARSVSDLHALHKVKRAVGPKTMLWIVFPKGRKDITEMHVFAHGKGIGLVDVKVCKFSEELTALKFVQRKSA